MIFTQLARLVAFGILVLGLCQIGLGLAIATGHIGPYEAALARYTTETSSGAVINKGTYATIVAVALGTLAEISFAVRRRWT